MKGLLAAIALVLVGVACRSSHIGAFEAALVQQIEKECSALTTCMVDLKKATPFTWDTLYVFETTSQLDAEKEVHQKLKEFPDFSRQFVFLLNGNVVGQESSDADIELARVNEIFFQDVVTPPGWVRLKANARIEVTRTDEGVKHFILREVR